MIKSLCKSSDVLIEPFRPGVMEKLGLGPTVLMKENPKLIYARLTGFGQNGLLAPRAGHDINYLAISGILSMLGRKNENPTAPINLMADFAGGGLICALGICLALLERHNSGKGQIIDSAMVEGAAYVGSWLFRSQQLPIWGNDRGSNILDTGAHFYDTYKTKNGKFMSVGSIEPQFYKLLLQGLGITNDNSQFANYDENKILFTDIFLRKTQNEWSEIFDQIDACVMPVLNWEEAPNHPHNQERKVFVDLNKSGDVIVPNPAPKLSRTPGISGVLKKEVAEEKCAVEILKEIGLDLDEIKMLHKEGVLLLDNPAKL